MKKITAQFFVLLILLSFTFSPLIDNNNFLRFSGTSKIKGFSGGLPYYSYFTNKDFVEKEFFGIVQDTLGNIIVTNRRGIIVFDSKDYFFVFTSGMPENIKVSEFSGRIYVACNNSLGYLDNLDSAYIFKEIYKNEDFFSTKIDIAIDSQNVYFNYGDFVIKYDEKNSEIEKIRNNKYDKIDNIIVIDNKIYAYYPFDGFYEIIDAKITDNFIAFDGNLMNFFVKFDDKSVFGTIDNRLYIVDSQSVAQIKRENVEYLSDKIINGAIRLTTDIVAISTVNGGVAFFDIQKQKIISVLNTYSGLPDNEVFAISADNNGGLWISNNYGLFRYDYTLPVKNYGFYPGLEGKVLTTQVIDTTLYVFTTQGAFYLTKPKSDAEFERVLKAFPTRRKAQYNTEMPNSDNSDIDEQNIESENTGEIINTDTVQKKDNFLKRWSNKIFKRKNKNKKNKDNENQEEDNAVDTTTTDVSENTQPEEIQDNTTITPVRHQYIYVQKKKQEKNFSELYYIFKKIDGLDAKCKQTLAVGCNIFVATNSGLFEINNNKVRTILPDEYITRIYASKDNENLYVATTKALYQYNIKQQKSDILFLMTDINDNIMSIEEAGDTLWLGGEGYAYEYLKNTAEINEYPVMPDFPSYLRIMKLKHQVLCYIPQGIYKFNIGLKRMTKYKIFDKKDLNSIFFVGSQNDILWIKFADKWQYQSQSYKIDSGTLKILNIIPSIEDIKIDENNNLWVVASDNSIYQIFKDTINSSLSRNYRLNVREVRIGNKNYLTKNISVKYSENLKFTVVLSSPNYIASDKNEFQYCVSHRQNHSYNWSEWKTSNQFEIPLQIGTNYLCFRAKNVFNQTTEIIEFVVKVKPPFWQTSWFKLLLITAVFSILIFLLQLRQRILKRRNQELEAIVAQRTAEIQKQNEELKVQKEEIEKQNQVVREQRDKIKQTHEYIKQSINYARRIQTAILPAQEILAKNVSDNFILSIPKDVVSGDFYWFKEFNGKLYVTVADCTGHGVPGAFLSMLGTAYLNEIVTYKRSYTAGQILNALRQNIIYSLQEREDNDIRDGMDVNMLIIDPKEKTANYAGAYQNLYLYRNNEMEIFKGDRMPVGFSRKNNIKFTDHYIDLQEEDIFYLFTDGYADQFGGKGNRKFFTANFRKLLLAIADSPLKIQKELLEAAFYEWKGNNRQIDDITVVGLMI